MRTLTSFAHIIFLSPFTFFLQLKPDQFLMASHLKTTGRRQDQVSHKLLAARHKRAHPVLTPASKAGTRFTYLGGMEG